MISSSSSTSNKKGKKQASSIISPSKKTINFVTTATSSQRSYRLGDATPRQQQQNILTNSTDTNNNHSQRSSNIHSPSKIRSKPNFSQNQKSLIKKVQQLASQHHKRVGKHQQSSSSSFISCSSSSNKMYGVQKSSKIETSSIHHQPMHSNNKLSINSNSGLFDSSCVKLATPTYAGMTSSSTIYENSNSSSNHNNIRQSSISCEKVISPSGIRQSMSSYQSQYRQEKIVSSKPSNENSPDSLKREKNAKKKKQISNNNEEDVRFYDRLFQKLGEESPYPNHPSTTYSPLPSSVARKTDFQLLSTPGNRNHNMPEISLVEEDKNIDMTTNTAGFMELNSVELESHQNSKNIIVRDEVENIKEEQQQSNKEEQEEQEEELSPIAKNHPSNNMEQQPMLQLRQSGQSFLNISNGEPDMNLRSFLKQSYNEDNIDNKMYNSKSSSQNKQQVQVPALQLQPTSLIPQCDSSPEPIRLTKQFMRKSNSKGYNLMNSSSKRESIFNSSSNKKVNPHTSRHISSSKRLNADKNLSMKTSRIITPKQQSQSKNLNSKKPRPFQFSFTNNQDCNMSKNSRIQTQGSDIHSNNISFNPKNSIQKTTTKKIHNALTINTSINRDQFNNSLIHHGQNTCKNAVIAEINFQDDDLQKGSLKNDIEGALVARPVTTRAKSMHYKSFKQNLPSKGSYDEFPLFRKKKEHSSSASLQLRNKSTIKGRINQNNGEIISSSNYSSKNGGSSTARFQDDNLNSARNSQKWKYSYNAGKIGQKTGQQISTEANTKKEFLMKGTGVGGGTPCKKMLQSSFNNRKNSIQKKYDSLKKGSRDTSFLHQNKSLSMKKRYDFSQSGLKTTRHVTPQPQSKKMFQRNSSRTKSFLDNNQTATTNHSSINCSKSNKYQNSSLLESTPSSKNNVTNFGSNQNVTRTSPKISSPSIMTSTITKNSTSVSSPINNKKHNFISSPTSRNPNNYSKTLHFALFKTESNIKYGCIPVEEKIFSNPEKAFKSFISSLKEDDMLKDDDEGDKLQNTIPQRRQLKSVQKNLDMEQNDGDSPTPISHHLAKMLSNQKNLRLSKDLISDQSQVIQEEFPAKRPESGGKSGNHSKRASIQNERLNDNEQEDDLEFQLMQTLSKKGADLKAINDALNDVKISSGRESSLKNLAGHQQFQQEKLKDEEFKQFDDEVKLKNTGRVSPLQLPLGLNDYTNIKSKKEDVYEQENENYLKTERSSYNQQEKKKHHPSRSQNYSFGAGYQAADEQSTARKQIDQMITPRLSTEEETQEEFSVKNKSNQSSPSKMENDLNKKKNEGISKLKGKKHDDLESPEKIKNAKKQEVTQLKSAKRVTKTHKKNAIPNHSYQNSQKYFSLLNSVDFQKELLNLDKTDQRKCITEAPQIDMETVKEHQLMVECYGTSSAHSSLQKSSDGTQSSLGTKIERANKQIADVRQKVENAIDRVNEKVEYHQMKQKQQKQGEIQSSIEFKDGVKNYTKNLNLEQMNKPKKFEQSKIPSPSRNNIGKSSKKGNYDLPLLNSSKIGKSWGRKQEATKISTPKGSQKISTTFKQNTQKRSSTINKSLMSSKENEEKVSILRNISPSHSNSRSQRTKKPIQKQNSTTSKASKSTLTYKKQIDAKIIVQESKYRGGMGKNQQSNRNNSLIIKQFDDLKMQIGSPNASFSLFYRIQDLASRIIQRNYKAYITRKRVLQNVKRISLAKKRMNKQLEAFQIIKPDFKVYKSSETQTDFSSSANKNKGVSLQQLIFTGEIIKRFGFSAFYTMRAFHYLILKMNRDGSLVKKQQSKT